MRRVAVAVAVLGGVLIVLGGGVLAWLGTSRSGVEMDVKPRPPEAPDRRVTRFGPGDPRQGSAPVYPPGQLPPPSAPVPSTKDAQGTGDAPKSATAGDTDAGEVVIWALDEAGLRDAIDSQHGELFACYKTLLESHPDAEGRMKVQFHIGADGRVDAADVIDATYDSLYLEGCIVTSMEDLRFEPPADPQGLLVTRGYEFTSGE